ncbi:MAG: Spy/CpxP family protein refolding chaperone [Deltaproteobacteria bacterium]|nr:Spy/CpxP family protein refolding chaperone [Deltaproteobacteria bacterium]
MKQKVYQVAFSATLVVMTVAFLFTIFLANASLSFASSGKTKSSEIVVSSAADHTEARIKQLHGALKITETQEELWGNLTQVMRENAKDMDALTKDRAENTKTTNAVEHMKLHSQITEVHLDQLKKFIPPFEALYASMSDNQKKNADTIFRTGKYGKHYRTARYEKH